MAASFPSSVVTTALLGGVANGIATALSSGINNSVTTIPVVDTTNFPSAGYATIGTEIFYYASKTSNSFTSVTRGVDGSAAASHSSGDAVNLYIVAAHVSNLQNEVVAIEQNISDRFGLGSTTIVIPSAVTAFSIDTDVFKVNTVTNLVGVGTANPKKKFSINDSSSSSTTVGSNPIVWISGANSSINTVVEIGFTYGSTSAFSETFAPATIGYQLTSGSGFTKGDIVFGTRNVTTDTQPTEAMRIAATGLVSVAAGLTVTNGTFILTGAPTNAYDQTNIIYINGLVSKARVIRLAGAIATDQMIYSGAGADDVRIAGTSASTITDWVTFTASAVTSTVIHSGPNGTAGGPTYGLTSEASGMYRVSAAILGFSVSGTKRLTVEATALSFFGNSHGYIYIDRSANTNEGILIFSTGGVTKTGIGMDNDSTDNLHIFVNGNLGTPVIHFFSTGGMNIGAPTGGDKGSGTLNVAGDLYKNNTAYGNPDYVLEMWATGKIEKFKGNDGASAYPGIMPIYELESYMRENLDIPGVKERFRDATGGQGIFARADIALEKIEESFIYIVEMHNRQDSLEERVEKLEAKVFA